MPKGLDQTTMGSPRTRAPNATIFENGTRQRHSYHRRLIETHYSFGGLLNGTNINDLSKPEGHFSCRNLSTSHNLENIALTNWIVHAYYMNCRIKIKHFLRPEAETHCRSGNISEMVFKTDVVTRDHYTVLKSVPPLACYNFHTYQPISTIFYRNVTEKSKQPKDTLFSHLV